MSETKPAPSALIEFSSEARDDPNEGVVFEQAPVRCVCPHCQRDVTTFIDHETSWVTWLLGFLVWLALGWMAFWVLPVLWPAFKDTVHRCPRCLNQIAVRSRISLPTFKTEVMYFKVGSCAIVLARKYVIIVIGLIGVIATVYCLRSSVHLQVYDIPKGPVSKLGWEDFLQDCGPKPRLRHRPSALHAFEEKYRHRTLTWEGEVKQIREGFDVFLFHTKSVLMLQMYPPRYPLQEHPDIAILFGESQNGEVAELLPGDWIEFEATMAAKGHRGDPEVMMLWRIEKKPKPQDLNTVPFSTASRSTPRAEPGHHAHHGRPAEAAGGGRRHSPGAEPRDAGRAVADVTAAPAVSGEGDARNVSDASPRAAPANLTAAAS